MPTSIDTTHNLKLSIAYEPDGDADTTEGSRESSPDTKPSSSRSVSTRAYSAESPGLDPTYRQASCEPDQHEELDGRSTSDSQDQGRLLSYLRMTHGRDYEPSGCSGTWRPREPQYDDNQECMYACTKEDTEYCASNLATFLKQQRERDLRFWNGQMNIFRDSHVKDNQKYDKEGDEPQSTSTKQLVRDILRDSTRMVHLAHQQALAMKLEFNHFKFNPAREQSQLQCTTEVVTSKDKVKGLLAAETFEEVKEPLDLGEYEKQLKEQWGDSMIEFRESEGIVTLDSNSVIAKQQGSGLFVVVDPYFEYLPSFRRLNPSIVPKQVDM